MGKEKKKDWRKPYDEAAVSLFMNDILRCDQKELSKFIQDALDSRPLLFWSKLAEHKHFPMLVRAIEIRTAMGGEADKQQLDILRRFKQIEKPVRRNDEQESGKVLNTESSGSTDAELEVSPELSPAELADFESGKSVESSPLFNVQ